MYPESPVTAECHYYSAAVKNMFALWKHPTQTTLLHVTTVPGSSPVIAHKKVNILLIALPVLFLQLMQWQEDHHN